MCAVSEFCLTYVNIIIIGRAVACPAVSYTSVVRQHDVAVYLAHKPKAISVAGAR